MCSAQFLSVVQFAYNKAAHRIDTKQKANNYQNEMHVINLYLPYKGLLEKQ